MPPKRDLARLTCLPLMIFVIGSASTKEASAQELQLKPNVRHGELQIELKRESARGGFISQPIKVPIDDAEPFLAVGAVWNA